MKTILAYILFLIATFTFSYILIVSADSEAQIQDNREKAYQEYIYTKGEFKMKALQLLKELQNGVIPFDEKILKAIQELEILETEVIELREANKDFLDTIIAAQQNILKRINKWKI